jgi:hypothetical protein
MPPNASPPHHAPDPANAMTAERSDRRANRSVESVRDCQLRAVAPSPKRPFLRARTWGPARRWVGKHGRPVLGPARAPRRGPSRQGRSAASISTTSAAYLRRDHRRTGSRGQGGRGAQGRPRPEHRGRRGSIAASARGYRRRHAGRARAALPIPGREPHFSSSSPSQLRATAAATTPDRALTSTDCSPRSYP